MAKSGVKEYWEDMMMMSTYEQLKQNKLVAIARGIEENYIPQLIEALVNGGIKCVEVTFDHTREDGIQRTIDCIRRMNEEGKNRVLVGAGTVLSASEVSMAFDAGAKYIISPNVNAEVIAKTKQLGLVSLPGAMTPTECQYAVECGADLVKLFPAGNLGVSYFKAILAPLKHIGFVPTGGITPENLPEFLRAGAVGAGIGSNLINAAYASQGRFDLIEEAARKFTQAAGL